jgi:acetoin utilization deacetylase AcuC-like enzyme
MELLIYLLIFIHRVLVFSIHSFKCNRNQNEELEKANFYYIGENSGKGYNVNVPLLEVI